LLILLTQGSTIKVRVFQDREEAAEWLGVPVELLAYKEPVIRDDQNKRGIKRERH
jgi:hypothetical protein